jgi:hypothetical protein
MYNQVCLQSTQVPLLTTSAAYLSGLWHCPSFPAIMYGGANCGVLQEFRGVALACCKAAEVLHKVDVVHSDFRSSNVVRLDATHWMVIDLENCRRPSEPLPVGFSLLDWNAGTLEGDDDKGYFYTTASDMYQIGMMLFSSLTACSPNAKDFVNKLVLKKLTASEALQHSWLAQPWEE